MSGKLIVLTRQKLMWTVVMLFGVMGPLLVASYKTPVQDVTGQVGKMLTYSSEREGITFNYPLGWAIRTERNFGGEILESTSFASPDKTVHGFVQVMEFPKPVPEYIAEAQKNMVSGYDSLEFKETTAGDKQGYVLTYKRGTGDTRSAATEYFFTRNKKVYRFSYFFPERLAEQYEKDFEEMLGSFNLPKQGK